MTEDEARDWLLARPDVPRETFARLEAFIRFLLSHADEQNLVSRHDRNHLWSRHVVDSAQLVDWSEAGTWADLGSGSGFPGIVVACLRAGPVMLIEQRTKRAAFLQAAIDHLGLRHAAVSRSRVESMAPRAFGTISARAFAPAPVLFATAAHLSDRATIWVLPKGRNAINELEAVREAWQGAFRIEQSVTDLESAIIVARDVRRRPPS